MGAVHFILKDKEAEKETLIFLTFNHKKLRFKYSVGEKINPKAWDESIERPIYDKKNKTTQNISKLLDDIQNEFDQVLFSFKYQHKTISKDELKFELDKRLNRGTKRKETVTLMSYLESFIKDCENGKRLTPKGLKYKEWTIKGYKTTQFHLTEFQKNTNKKLDFDNITIDFYDDFINYFQGNKAATNTIGKHIKNLKSILKNAKEEKLHSNTEFERKKFKIIYEVVDKIYLTENELSNLYNLDLNKNKSFDRARDLFILACYTGLRFSDLSKITKDRINENDKGTFLTINTEKTSEKVVIPLKSIVLSILRKYDYEIPRVITNQKLNDYIKDIAELAGINEIVESKITKGGLLVTKQYKKFKLITTHTARRSFATNLYLAGIPTISIMKITGHRTEKSFLKYIRISQEDNAYKIADHPYFKLSIG
ncbi:MAG: tyrosine-type recombinase/integrase [Bacteroidales bacterium]|jgi:integrase|nr:tyrosine-type recombinase/integrase [Bacteroidales bacterium]